MLPSAGEALQAARARLASTSTNPRSDAELLLAHVLGWNRTGLLTHPERRLSAAELAQFEVSITRRLNHEPMQYILGMQEFFGLDFEISSAVLIPRPETEHLVEAALKHLSSESSARVLDVGTGSGAIAVAVAHARPKCQVTAVDISPAALAVARRNAETHGVLDRVRLLQSDLLASVDGAQFDLVISNPPYVADADTLERQVAEFEPHCALYAGPTGLEIYQRLIPQSRRVLGPDGWLMVEIGFGQLDAVAGLLRQWRNVSSTNDLQGIPRVVQAQA